MTQVTVNGNTYSDDGTTSKDMQHGGHRQWLLPMISDLMVVINGLLGGSFTVTFRFQRPLTGATLTATTGLGAFVIQPAGPIAALNVVLPPGPTDGQIFELSTQPDDHRNGGDRAGWRDGPAGQRDADRWRRYVLAIPSRRYDLVSPFLREGTQC